MNRLCVIVLILLTGCTLSPEQRKQASIWYDVYSEAQAVVEYHEQANDVWLTYSEIDPTDVDCDGITFWMIGRARELGADGNSAWCGIFQYDDDKYHMAPMIEGIWNYPVVVPSSGMWTMKPMSLSDYENQTGMEWIEKFQITLVEID